MTTTLKKRVETLEEQVRKLAEAVQPESLRKDWRDTFATSADDEGFDEMVRLGQAKRRGDISWRPCHV